MSAAALYAALLRDPEDRLCEAALRDALDEEDDPLGEAMRLGLGGDFPAGEIPSFQVPWRGLLAQVWASDAVPWWRLTVRDGLVREITAFCREFVEPRAARRVFAAYPITRVSLPDRSPFHGVLGEPLWRRDDYFVRDTHETLPSPLFDRLESGRPAGSCRYYATADEARDDLSLACVAYGRWVASP